MQKLKMLNLVQKKNNFGLNRYSLGIDCSYVRQLFQPTLFLGVSNLRESRKRWSNNLFFFLHDSSNTTQTAFELIHKCAIMKAYVDRNGNAMEWTQLV